MKKLILDELNRKTTEEFKQAAKKPVIIILDNIRSLHNIGAVFRTADAFLIQKIYLCGITACPPHKEIRKTALGATETVEWEYREDVMQLLKELKEQSVCTIALEQTEGSVMLQDFTLKPDTVYALIFGNEVKGVQQSVVDNCDAVIEIPQEGTKHSLNVSVSAGIAMWDFYRKIAQL
ncbi:RNA methyltransferase [Avrilella dinanensis]|uniref:RNA methyltransferase n=1 Tax=Avrilella dinanensis TaxID=2008672 RepID=A0A2M9R5R4_9FLAO|nr:RNA methyltransferase [Avrilella dinanensis]PJR04216.1 RNA methyltransferase [Avrilella dinanensis]